jgi:thiamine-monophosphate kinase
MPVAMHEFRLIAAIRRVLGVEPAPPLLVGAGDDAAVLARSRNPTAVTTDSQIEGVHFRLAWLKPRAVGARAVEITLSDLAAMGARPRALVAAICFPRRFPMRDAISLARGVCAAGSRRACPVAGGNVAVYDGPLAVTLTALGELPGGRTPLLRSAAKPGHVLCVTGMPGLARLGLEALARGEESNRQLSSAVRKYLRPRARLKEAEFLAAETRLGAAIDLSDGLAGDLGHVLSESGAGAVLRPCYPRLYRTMCGLLDLDPEECFLGPSDDYELLFTVRSSSVERLGRLFRERFRRPLLAIGSICAERGLWIENAGGKRRRVTLASYEHKT